MTPILLHLESGQSVLVNPEAIIFCDPAAKSTPEKPLTIIHFEPGVFEQVGYGLTVKESVQYIYGAIRFHPEKAKQNK
jgi:hypothetical protein